MKLKKNIATSENGFVFNPSTGDSFSSNPIAATILGLLKAGHSTEEIKIDLLAQYEVEPSQLERDIDDFLHQLRDENLLEMD
jgi:hypothetical protein